MKLALTMIKADIGSVSHDVAPFKRLQRTVEAYIREQAAGLLLDHYISHTGNDIAILMTHIRGQGDEQIHELACNAFRTGTDQARRRGEMLPTGGRGHGHAYDVRARITGIAEKLKGLDQRFSMRSPAPVLTTA